MNTEALKKFTRPQQEVIAMSRALWVRDDGMVMNGMVGASFGTTARQARAALVRAGYRKDSQDNKTFRRTW